MRNYTMFLPALALGVAGAICVVAPSLAEQITYTMQFIADGCIGPSSITQNCSASPTFKQADVTLTMVNDTGNIVLDTSGPSPLHEINGTATVSVNGGAAGTFMDQMQFYTDSSTIVGIFDAFVNVANGGLDIVDEFNTGSAFTGYQLGPIGPTTDAAGLGAGQPINFQGYELRSGDFFILNGLGPTSDATFTATVAAVPAPPIGRGLSVALAVGGTLFGANLLRRRFRNPLTRRRLAPHSGGRSPPPVMSGLTSGRS
jgi:hypothetical protein